MTLLAIEHVQLAMPAAQEEIARRFYVDVLGLAEKPQPPNLANRGGAWFESSLIKVHLGVDADFRPATKAHIAILVDDLSTLIERCRRAGVRMIDDEPLEGYQRVYVFDPFGNRLEFMQLS